MLSPVNRSVHLELNIELEEPSINALLAWYAQQRAELLQQIAGPLFVQLQQHWLDQVRQAEQEMICTACGVVHGPHGWVQRGTRRRRLKTLFGEVQLDLLQVTCGACGSTRAAAAQALGLAPGERMSQALEQCALERVFTLSYRRSVQAIVSCAGVRLSASTLHRRVQRRGRQLQLTPDPVARVVLADGTKVRAGDRAALEELRMAVQVLGREKVGGRTRARLRLLGLEVGPRGWPKVMQPSAQTRVVVTDAEPALRAQVRDCYTGARHQQCEWHMGRSLDWSLRTDGVGLLERKQYRDRLQAILWGPAPLEQRRGAYDQLADQLSHSPTSQKQLRQARRFVLLDPPPSERTTSLLERQMREVDRRAWNGARWSNPGLGHLLRLSFAHTHNPDDYQRLWDNRAPTRASAMGMSRN